MTPEAQRIAIAEACGWQHVTICQTSTGMFRKGSLIGTSTVTERTQYVPNYLNDLNAMHEAVLTLFEKDHRLFIEYLTAQCPFFGGTATSLHWFVCNATAAQRAEAFLKTLNLWKQ